MPSFNLWAPDLQLKPSPVVCGVSAVFILLALNTLWFIPLPVLSLWVLAGLIVAAAVWVMLNQVMLVSDSAISRVSYRDSTWWLTTRAGTECSATLRPNSVVSPWFVLLNFSLDKNTKRHIKSSAFVKSSGFQWIKSRKRSVLILPDSLYKQSSKHAASVEGADAENFRRLRVFLRFGKGL